MRQLSEDRWIMCLSGKKSYSRTFSRKGWTKFRDLRGRSRACCIAADRISLSAGDPWRLTMTVRPHSPSLLGSALPWCRQDGVPKGRKVDITFSDGTKMYVNAGSRVIYPALFAKDKREIVARALGVLTGLREKDLNSMSRSNYEQLTLLSIPDAINAEVIQYRPDYLKAQDYIEKIGIDARVAKRDFLPKFILYGQAGFSAYNLGNIFGDHTFKSLLGFLPSIDLFTGGAKMARFRWTKLELEKAQQLYEKTILTSIQEVNDSLSSAKTREKNYKESVKRYNLENEKYALAGKKFNIGAKSNLDLMKDSEKLLVADKDKVNSRINYLLSTIDVYKAIGGKDFTTINDNL